ncbi:glutamyl-tRNA reductase [Nocardia iowensis]|uniref:Glutamyl-tRNA reductase n=1 Tax=Nocardia iowensis TaxID=204891 RepID=A0ABX8RUB0_NOCIO|nr:glutamyl-tRNA reductase [Nocardia iowensis]QXN93217.1 glutamyl-tRNA reductase [Nocardia iowensis]
MTIVNVEISFRTASADRLELFAGAAQKIDDHLSSLIRGPAIDEAVVLATCNRVEIYASANSAPAAAEAVLDCTAAAAGLPAAEVRDCARVRRDAPAVEHLFSVACGLESMALGENQIVAQMRRAVRNAQQAVVIGTELHDLFDAALRASKLVRSKTSIGGAGISLVHSGLELAASCLGGLQGRTALLIGSGTIGSLSGRLLRAAEVGDLLVYGRTPAKAARLAETVAGRSIPLAELPEALAAAEVIVSSTSAKGEVITADQLAAARAQAGWRPQIVLDLAMPRDVDPACARIEGVTVADVHAVGAHLAAQDVAIDVEKSRQIVAEEVANFLAEVREKTAAPLISALHRRVRADIDEELDRLYRRVPSLDAQARAATSAAVHRLAGRFLHGPTTRTKEMSRTPEGLMCLDVFTRIFDLEQMEVGS